MIYIHSPFDEAAFNFAAEEYCLTLFENGVFAGDEAVSMLWQADNCVMLGSYQVAAAEIDLAEAGRRGVNIVRRPSGGGTIYTDLGVFQYTVIVPYRQGDDFLTLQRKHLAEPLTRALAALGVPAELRGRNDLMAGDRKISGLAQWMRHGRLCSHASILYSADLDVLARLLRPDEEKIRSKALSSVRSRVGNIADLLPAPPPAAEFREKLTAALLEQAGVFDPLSGKAPSSAREYRFSLQDLEAVAAIRNGKYGSTDWTFGKTPDFDYHFSRRFPPGKVEVSLKVSRGKIVSCAIHGDFLGLVPTRGLEEKLEGLPHSPEALRAVLAELDLAPFLGGIGKEQFLECMF